MREWLKIHKRTQLWLAEQIGHSPKHVNAILKGHALWSAAMAFRIEQATEGDLRAKWLMELKAEYELDQVRGDAQAQG